MLTRRGFLAGSSLGLGSLSFWSIAPRAGAAQPITAAHSVNTAIYAAHMVAQAQGFMKANDLDMHVIEAKGGSNVRRILAAGQVGYALGDSSHPLQLTTRGRSSKILMATDNRCSYANIVARKELVEQGYDSVEKLAEYKREDGSKPVIAATGIGSGTWVYGTYVLEQFGVADHFHWIAGGGTKTILGGLKTGKFDAIMAVPAWFQLAEKEGFGQLIYDISDEAAWTQIFAGEIPASVVYVLDSAISDNAEITQGYINAIYQSMQWLKDADVDQIYAAIGEQMAGIPEASARQEIEYYKNIYQYDGSFPEASFNNGAKVWFREQTKMAPVAYQDVADMSFLENARKAVA